MGRPDRYGNGISAGTAESAANGTGIGLKPPTAPGLGENLRYGIGVRPKRSHPELQDPLPTARDISCCATFGPT